LKQYKNPNVRAEAAIALAYMENEPRITESLMEALEDYEQLFQNVDEKTYRTNAIVRDSAALAILKMKPANEQALRAIFPYILKFWKKQVLIETIKYIGKPAIKLLIESLKDQDVEIRKNAIIYLGEFADIESLEPLSEMLDDDSMDIRNEVIKALKKLGNPAQKSLIKALADKKDNVRQLAAYALKDIGDEEALEAIRQAKADKSWWVRGAAKGAEKEILKRLKKESQAI
jgi:HEAT repeat protein